MIHAMAHAAVKSEQHLAIKDGVTVGRAPTDRVLVLPDTEYSQPLSLRGPELDLDRLTRTKQARA